MPPQDASVAKLVDATDSKSVDGNIMLVQVRPEVPIKIPSILGRFLFKSAQIRYKSPDLQNYVVFSPNYDIL